MTRLPRFFGTRPTTTPDRTDRTDRTEPTAPPRQGPGPANPFAHALQALRAGGTPTPEPAPALAPTAPPQRGAGAKLRRLLNPSRPQSSPPPKEATTGAPPRTPTPTLPPPPHLHNPFSAYLGLSHGSPPTEAPALQAPRYENASAAVPRLRGMQWITESLRNAAAHKEPTLRLDGLAVPELPLMLGTLTHLKKLSVSHTECEHLPHNIGNLSNLQHLSLTINPRLQALPASLTQLTQLKTLTVGMTPLLSVPADIGKLVHLESLTLNGGRFTELPESLTHLTALKTLSISHSDSRGADSPGLIRLPEHMGRLASLETLTLKDHKELRTLPVGLTGLSNLRTLDLSDCPQLARLPSGMAQLKNLEVLRLENCTQLTVLPDQLGQLTQLNTLDLRGCDHLHELSPALLRQLPANCEVLWPDHLRPPPANLTELAGWQAQLAPFNEPGANEFKMWLDAVTRSHGPKGLPPTTRWTLHHLVQTASSSAGVRAQLFDLAREPLQEYYACALQHALAYGPASPSTVAMAQQSLISPQDLLLKLTFSDPEKMPAHEARVLLAATLKERRGAQDSAAFAEELAGFPRPNPVPGEPPTPRKPWDALDLYVQTHDPEGSRIAKDANKKMEALLEQGSNGEVTEHQMYEAMQALNTHRDLQLRARRHAFASEVLDLPTPGHR